MALFYPDVSSQLGIPLWLLIVAGVWSIIWKGIALWRSSRLNQPIWFIALLVINTLGILEILYIFLFSKINLDKSSKVKVTRGKVRKKTSRKTQAKSRRKSKKGKR